MKEKGADEKGKKEEEKKERRRRQKEKKEGISKQGLYMQHIKWEVIAMIKYIMDIKLDRCCILSDEASPR